MQRLRRVALQLEAASGTHEHLFQVPVIASSWDDLLEGVESAGQWADRREELRAKYLRLLRDEHAPSERPPLDLRLEEEVVVDGIYKRQVRSHTEFLPSAVTSPYKYKTSLCDQLVSYPRRGWRARARVPRPAARPVPGAPRRALCAPQRAGGGGAARDLQGGAEAGGGAGRRRGEGQGLSLSLSLSLSLRLSL